MTVDEIEKRVREEIRKGLTADDMSKVTYFGAIGQEISEGKKDWERKIKAWDQSNGNLAQPQGASSLAGTRKIDPRRQDYTRWPLRSYELDGNEIAVRTFKDMLVQLANFLRHQHGEAFDDFVLTLSGRKRRYFSKSGTTLKSAYELGAGGLFVETNLNSNLIAQLCFSMAVHFGHHFTIN